MFTQKSHKRREFLITSATLAVASFVPHTLFAESSGSEPKKILIAYFSHSGNTRLMAEDIQRKTDADLYEITTLKPYPQDYDTVVDIAKKEQKAKFRPQIAPIPENLSNYDIIFIGYPSWWGTIPMALFTFFEANHFEGKTLIPFSTHEGSHFGDSLSDLKALNPQSTFLKGLELRGRSVQSASSKKEVTKWLLDLKIAQR